MTFSGSITISFENATAEQIKHLFTAATPVVAPTAAIASPPTQQPHPTQQPLKLVNYRMLGNPRCQGQPDFFLVKFTDGSSEWCNNVKVRRMFGSDFDELFWNLRGDMPNAQFLMEDVRCSAVVKKSAKFGDGTPCVHPATRNGRCGHHARRM